jgi:multimeric flavodoxin WrbA
MRVLGLSAGNPNGSAEIALKRALRAAEASGADIELVRLHDLRLSSGPDAEADDTTWFWERLLACDGLIVSTPIYSRTIPGLLRLLGDKFSGPHSDVAFTAEIIRMRATGETLAVDFAVDERVLRPRVAGFIAVGGAIPTRWRSLALPLLHTLTTSAQIAVVDQLEIAGAGSQGSVLLDEPALERAARVGSNVASQLGRPYDEAQYLGAPGLCPRCHLSVMLLDGSDVECATCGAAGRLAVVDGEPTVQFSPDGLAQSVLDYREKLEHFREVQQTAARHAESRDWITARVAEIATWDPRIHPDR